MTQASQSNHSISQRILAVVSKPAWVCFIWFGMTTGITLLATPIRFSAGSITREIALDVSRVVFIALNKAELIALILLLGVLRLSGRLKQYLVYALLLTLIVLAQSIWLLPELSARTDIVLSGQEPPASALHGIYSSLELSKLAILLIAGFRSLGKD